MRKMLEIEDEDEDEDGNEAGAGILSHGWISAE